MYIYAKLEQMFFKKLTIQTAKNMMHDNFLLLKYFLSKNLNTPQGGILTVFLSPMSLGLLPPNVAESKSVVSRKDIDLMFDPTLMTIWFIP